MCCVSSPARGQQDGIVSGGNNDDTAKKGCNVTIFDDHGWLEIDNEQAEAGAGAENVYENYR